jgi:hypothetical protein
MWAVTQHRPEDHAHYFLVALQQLGEQFAVVEDSWQSVLPLPYGWAALCSRGFCPVSSAE